MFHDRKITPNSDSKESLLAKEINNGFYENKIKGEVIDSFIYPDGTKKQIREMDYNLIVSKCSVLIATLFKNESGYTGIGYWAVGEGDSGWSDVSPPDPLVTDEQLESETYRKEITPAMLDFLDASNVVSLTPTNKVQITTLFEEAEANGPLREFGIFGGNATASANSGMMINHKIHPLIYKTSSLKLERILRLTF